MNEHRSFWLQQALGEETKAGDALEAPPLEGDARADVLIVGAGIAGCGRRSTSRPPNLLSTSP